MVFATVTGQTSMHHQAAQGRSTDPHRNGETMKNTIIILACLILSSCATPIAPNTPNTPEEINLPNLQNVVTATPLQIISITPTRTGSNEINLNIKIARHGQDEAISVETPALPSGLTSSTTMIAPQDQQATITLRGKVSAETTITIRLRSANHKLERAVSLKSVTPTQQGGTHWQSLQPGTSNLEPGVFTPTQIYANFKGSTCQVMVHGQGHGLYICFNGVLKAGKTYPLIPSRGLNNDTASITYFHSTNANGKPIGFWDSRSGFVTVKSLSQERIELLLQEVKLEPAKGFPNSAAQGEFTLEAKTQIDEISNFPEEIGHGS